MTRSYLLFGALVIVSLTILSGTIQGRMSNRWGKPADIQSAVLRLQQIPNAFGPWEMKRSDKIAEPVLRELDCAGYVLRTYVHRDTGASIQAVVLLGPPGPISVHSPDVCYSSRDYATVQDHEQWSMKDGPREHVFWTKTLEPVELSASLLRVYYAWTTGNQWSAPDDARFAFAGTRHLYKIQLAGPIQDVSDAGTDKDPGREFLTDFVPAAQPYLVPSETE